MTHLLEECATARDVADAMAVRRGMQTMTQALFDTPASAGEVDMAMALGLEWRHQMLVALGEAHGSTREQQASLDVHG